MCAMVGKVPGPWTWQLSTPSYPRRRSKGQGRYIRSRHSICWFHALFLHRIEQLDFLDERELLTQLLQHYCLSCGYNDRLKLGRCVCMWGVGECFLTIKGDLMLDGWGEFVRTVEPPNKGHFGSRAFVLFSEVVLWWEVRANMQFIAPSRPNIPR